MSAAILFLAGLWIMALALEARDVRRSRKKIKHIIHVNGTRGKSTTCRLIDAGLRSCGFRTFTKTTGTDPMTIDTAVKEEPVIRRGRTNIKEQIRILKRAAAQNADVLVIECMALAPELQYASQHRILNADIGVLTNVRRDHTDVMGETLPEICDVLCNTIPRDGILFTGEKEFFPQICRKGSLLHTDCRCITPDGAEPDFDFPENIALALSVCESLGADREKALEGMRHFSRDPYTLGMYRFGSTLFIDGLSINDIQSMELIWNRLMEKYPLSQGKRILLINNRPDRGSRTLDMLTFCLNWNPSEVWLLGASKEYLSRRIRRELPECAVTCFHNYKEIVPEHSDPGTVIYAVGNIAGQGRDLIARIREEGKPYV